MTIEDNAVDEGWLVGRSLLRLQPEEDGFAWRGRSQLHSSLHEANF